MTRARQAQGSGSQEALVSFSDRILKLDKQQGVDSPAAVYCPTDREHGRMGVHGNGQHLVCKCGQVVMAVLEEDR